MNKDIRVVNADEKTVCITTLDERWYGFESQNPKTGLPEWEFVPSITFITHYYPKGVGYMKWLADKGWDEAEALKTEAGDRGTIVHHAIEQLIREKKLAMDSKIKDREGNEREMTPDEYYCVMTFAQWYEEMGKPEVVAVEKTVRSKEYDYAGTLDYIFKTPEGNLLLDVKTSKAVYKSHVLQVSALKQACAENSIKVDSTGILQVGYTLNKTKHFKFTPTEDKFDLFLSTKQTWAEENDGTKPFQRDYPLFIEI